MFVFTMNMNSDLKDFANYMISLLNIFRLMNEIRFKHSNCKDIEFYSKLLKQYQCNGFKRHQVENIDKKCFCFHFLPEIVISSELENVLTRGKL